MAKKLSDKERAKFREEAKQKLEDFTRDAARKVVDIILQGTSEKWERPWHSDPIRNMPHNPASGHRFSGGNALALYLYLWAKGEADPRFCTFKQAKTLGEDTHVAKGAEGVYILRPVILKKKDAEAKDDLNAAENGDTGEEKEMVFFRPTKVFHASQIANMPALQTAGSLTDKKWSDHAMVERLVKASGVRVTHGFQQAAYFPGRDVIRMPDKNAFGDNGKFYPTQLENELADRGEYYSTLLHEWMHATGHESREKRAMGSTLQFNGLQEYAKEELRAETFSALSSLAFGLPYNLTTGADYLKHWNEKVKSDPKEIFVQAAYASKMLEVVMDFSMDQQPKAAWFPDKSTWPAKEVVDDLDVFQIDLQKEGAMFSEEDPFSELDDMEFTPSQSM